VPGGPRGLQNRRRLVQRVEVCSIRTLSAMFSRHGFLGRCPRLVCTGPLAQDLRHARPSAATRQAERMRLNSVAGSELLSAPDDHQSLAGRSSRCAEGHGLAGVLQRRLHGSAAMAMARHTCRHGQWQRQRRTGSIRRELSRIGALQSRDRPGSALSLAQEW